MTPVLYVKPGCPWCEDVLDYLKDNEIKHETAIVSGNREAMQRMQEISGQTKAPTLDWDGDILADFGVDELKPFLKERGII